MTPAKLLAMSEAHVEHMRLMALPVDRLTWIYANKNRNPGQYKYDDQGNPIQTIHEPDPFMPLDQFRTFGSTNSTSTRKSESLAAKDDEDWDSALMGARTSRSDWEAWGRSKSKTTFVRKEN